MAEESLEVDMSALIKGTKKVAGFLKKVLIGGGKKEDEPELEEGPVELLSGDEEKLRKARKKSIQQQISGSGRSSTILSQGGSGFGG